MSTNFDAFQNINIVLCDTSHNGNIGSSARAMKTMGFTKLVLVAPLVLPDSHSLALACNAKEVVDNCVIVQSLTEALKNTELAIAMTSRKREIIHNLCTPKEIMPEIYSHIATQSNISIVFGSERSGLTVNQLELCNRFVTIPGNPAYFSLNLAQAVQIMCYEIYSGFNPDIEYLKPLENLAKRENVYQIIAHLEKILEAIQFYNNKPANTGLANKELIQNKLAYKELKNKKPALKGFINRKEITMRRLQHILNKANLTKAEVDLIRGILKKINNLTLQESSSRKTF